MQREGSGLTVALLRAIAGLPLLERLLLKGFASGAQQGPAGAGFGGSMGAEHAAGRHAGDAAEEEEEVEEGHLAELEELERLLQQQEGQHPAAAALGQGGSSGGAPRPAPAASSSLLPTVSGSTTRGLATLASGCSRLQQLTLSQVGPVDVDAAAALMALPRLRSLQLLQCQGAPSQEECQALVGRLGLWRLQVDSLPGDGSLRSAWMSDKLQAEARREMLRLLEGPAAGA
jgi:hypothetical protein